MSKLEQFSVSFTINRHKHFKSVIYWNYFSCQENIIRLSLAHKTEIQKTLSGVLLDNLCI